MLKKAVLINTIQNLLELNKTALRVSSNFFWQKQYKTEFAHQITLYLTFLGNFFNQVGLFWCKFFEKR